MFKIDVKEKAEQTNKRCIFTRSDAGFKSNNKLEAVHF